MPPVTPILDSLRFPADLRSLSPEQLGPLAQELRAETIDAVSVTGGHLGAGLGVVELTVALHYVFDTPRDRLVWDVGHQVYPHKILTGRRDRMRRLRQRGGLSGFTRRAESEYDPFGAAHASTSISAGLGMATARGGDRQVVCVVGDGAMSAGMAFEAMNNAGAADAPMIVILNDNKMSIAPPVGALSTHLARLALSRPTWRCATWASRWPTRCRPSPAPAFRRSRNTAAATAQPRSLFEAMGFYYIGPIDGHDLDRLVPVLRDVRDARQRPVLVHVVTEKGKGYAPAEAAADKFHGVGTFDVATGKAPPKKKGAPSYTSVFADGLCREARADPDIVAITAAMPAGTGVATFAKEFPDRTHDVGIAEQHAVTFAAGLATEGRRPFCAIYSTFLQRAYDQVVHDVALQNLPVRFAIDRAGLVGADGPTHAGAFDLAYLCCLPNMVVMAAADEAELARMVVTAARHDSGPIAFRYPRGAGTGVAIPDDPEPLEIGRGRVLRQGSRVAILSLGGRLAAAMEAADRLEARGISATVADARFAKPLDRDLIRQLAADHDALITIEEGAAGGFGAHVLQAMAGEGLLDHGLKVRTMTLPDRFQEQDLPERQYAEAGLDADAIVATAISACGADLADQASVAAQ